MSRVFCGQKKNYFQDYGLYSFETQMVSCWIVPRLVTVLYWKLWKWMFCKIIVAFLNIREWRIIYFHMFIENKWQLLSSFLFSLLISFSFSQAVYHVMQMAFDISKVLICPSTLNIPPYTTKVSEYRCASPCSPAENFLE